MSEISKIEWTDATFNPWIGCTKVSPACDHCYAEVSTPARALGVVWGPKAERQRTTASNWKMPQRWNRGHDEFFAEHGRRRRVFCASLADVFDNAVPPSWRADLFALIESTPNLDWLLLTKRIGNVPGMMINVAKHLSWLEHLDSLHLPENIWLGATISTQEEADRDIPKLLAVPARVRFLSMEPLLGNVDVFSTITGELLHSSGNDHDPGCIDWVIVGGESGHDARAMHPDWARNLRDQCMSAGVPYLFKQWGEWSVTEAVPGGDLGGDIRRRSVLIVKATGENGGHFRRGDALMRRVGKKVAGRLLDGVQHDGFPCVGAKDRS